MKASFSELLLVLVALLGTASSISAAQTDFALPEDAANALLAAIKTRDYPTFLSVAGREMEVFWNSGDPLRDALQFDRFVDEAHRIGLRLDALADGRQMLYIGSIEQPFPAPLVRTTRGWSFDAQTGSFEVVARRIHRNEQTVLELCRRLREAEFTYREISPDGNRMFAESIRSTTGKRDGLFWMGGEGDESPLGPVFARAAYMERQPGEEPKPLFGYYFRILSGRSAPLHGDFAFLAWPAEYRVSGVRSFLITESGETYQYDFGPDAARIAQTATLASLRYHWKPAEPTGAVARLERD